MTCPRDGISYICHSLSLILINFLGTTTSHATLPLWMQKERSYYENQQRFTEFVDASLHQFCELKLCIEHLRWRVSIHHNKKSTSMLNKWIAMAVVSEVRDLAFEVVLSDGNTLILHFTSNDLLC